VALDTGADTTEHNLKLGVHLGVQGGRAGGCPRPDTGGRPSRAVPDYDQGHLPWRMTSTQGPPLPAGEGRDLLRYLAAPERTNNKLSFARINS
jgi:hypothetical protein